MLFKLARRLPSMILSKRSAQTSMSKQDPNNYSIPLRPVTMDDMMEPYGSWKVAYAAEKRNGNIALIKGFVCLAITLTIMYQSGIYDGIVMPNLDNIMEETVPFENDLEGRKTVK